MLCQQYPLQSPVNGVIAANVIREKFTKFIEIMQRSTWLVNNLFENGLLSRPTLHKILTLNSPENLSIALLESVDIITDNGEKFNDLLLILASESVYESLIASLKTKYEQKLQMKTALPTMVATDQEQSKGVDTPSTSNVPLQDTLRNQPHIHLPVTGASSLMYNVVSPGLGIKPNTTTTQIVMAPCRPLYATWPSRNYQIPFPSTANHQVFQPMQAPQNVTGHSHFYSNPAVGSMKNFVQPMCMPQTDLYRPSIPYSVVPVQTSGNPLKLTVSSVEHTEVKVKRKVMANHEETLKAKYKKMEYPTDSIVNEYFDLFIIDTKERVCVNIEDIGILSDGSRAQCILVEGESGTGKTMLLHHLAKQWAAGKIFTQYRLVLLHTLFEAVSKYEFVELLDLPSYSDQDRDDLKLEIGKGKDLLFLIDAYNHPLSDIRCVIQFFPEASLIFTCPSERVDSIRGLIIKYTEQYLKVIGFTQNSREAYITACLSHGCQLEFREWIARNKFGFSLTYRPLYCMMLMELCMTKQLPDSLLNLTDLYKLFTLCIISKHIEKGIKGYSDLQGHDIDHFLSVASSATSEGALPISVEQSFGLAKCIKPFCSEDLICIFKHSSIQDYFLALYICLISAKEKLERGFPNPIPYSIIRFVVGLGRACDIYLICNKMGAKRKELCLQLFETRSPSSANYICGTLCNRTFEWDLKLEADPLYWYIFGWCLQSCELQWTLTYDVEKFFHTPLCLEMLYDGSNSSKTYKTPIVDRSVSSTVKLVKINFNGGSQLCDSLCKLSLLKSYTVKVKELNLSGTLDSNVAIDGLELDKYMPCLQILSISCQSSFGSPWLPMICSLPRLEHLSTLCICGANTHKLSKVLSTSIKACNSLKILRIERVLSEVLEDTLTRSKTDQLPGFIYIIDSTITEAFAEKLIQQIFKLRKLVFGRCIVHKTVLEAMLKSVLRCSAMKEFCFYGINSVGNEGAQVIADVIKNTPVAPLYRKSLLFHDTAISKSMMEQVINATSENKGIDLTIPFKYKLDFMNYTNVLYISDSQMIKYTYT